MMSFKSVFMVVAFAFLLCAQVSSQPKEKEYPLIWATTPNLQLVSLQKTKIENQRFELKKDKTVKKQLRVENVSLQCYSHVTLVDKQENKLVVSVLHRDGKITVKRGSRTFVHKIDDPEKAKEIKDPMVQQYLHLVSGGFVYRVDLNTREVEQTWRLDAVKVTTDPKDAKRDLVQYKRTVIGRDPLGISDATKVIPNKMVPIGFEWTRPRMGTQTEKLKFVEVVEESGRKLAKIDRGCPIVKEGKTVGSIKGEVLFDLEYGSVFKNTETITYDEYQTQPMKGGTEMYVLEKVKMEIDSNLYQTNFHELKKNK